MTNLTDYLGIAIVYINMIILVIVILLAVRLYMKYSKYIDIKRKYVQKRSRIYK
jgi:hypothetical protein